MPLNKFQLALQISTWKSAKIFRIYMQHLTNPIPISTLLFSAKYTLIWFSYYHTYPLIHNHYYGMYSSEQCFVFDILKYTLRNIILFLTFQKVFFKLFFLCSGKYFFRMLKNNTMKILFMMFNKTLRKIQTKY